MPAAWSSSGGKDSLLALHYARRQGMDVRTMITMFDETGLRSRSHGISHALMQLQADALQMKLIAPSASWQTYEAVFEHTLRDLARTDHDSVVFGDIDLQPHRDWEEKVCAQANLKAVLPLWLRDRRALAEEALQLGFKAIVVCVDHRHLGREFCGRYFDADFLRDLPLNVDACGENGEFHTFVFDGPLFKQPLKVRVDQLEDYQAPAQFGGVNYTFARLVADGRSG